MLEGQSVPERSEVLGAFLDTSVEGSGVLCDSVFHVHGAVPGPDEVEGLGLGNAGATLVLSDGGSTFLR